MMSLMSDAEGDLRSTTPGEDRGVLLNLPRTRPQRSSPRRAAARKAAAGTRAQKGGRPRRADSTTATVQAAAPSTLRGGAQRKPKRAKAATGQRARGAVMPHRGSTLEYDPAPRQGFESESESMSGSVHPPGGVELVTSAAEIVGELAKAGLSTGERLLKDVLSRLPRS